MRRKDREISAFEKMIDVVEACDCLRLGLVDTDGAYIVPLNFGYETEGETLTFYFHCAKEGRKMDLMQAQPKVSFEMDTGHRLTGEGKACTYTYQYQCVMGQGTVRELTDEDAKRRGLNCLMAHYTGQTEWAYKPSELEHVAVMALTVVNWSCKVH